MEGAIGLLCHFKGWNGVGKKSNYQILSSPSPKEYLPEEKPTCLCSDLKNLPLVSKINLYFLSPLH